MQQKTQTVNIGGIRKAPWPSRRGFEQRAGIRGLVEFDLAARIPNLTFKIRSDNGGGRAVIAFSEYGQACARDIVREMEYDLQLVWTTIPSDFKAYAIIIPAGRKWLVSWCIH
jgi:hypothetical protein